MRFALVEIWYGLGSTSACEDILKDICWTVQYVPQENNKMPALCMLLSEFPTTKAVIAFVVHKAD